ncbi:beta-1,4-N-acetylgalactosaminyltransferase bre-4-like isoform X1 [Haliotis rufescens]|uniref:beta-1,4-N-acetylgalactosaminyltransferase bre-4-like isoform X1 n=1 Tax=Haliotis rufescens TaxID=6454 RepID=UPI001EB0A4D1|nr:beta-1,4-N-acetylgalactosaminyltransferase bre-4-like isoform X1 [Haliotis rufescens]
MIKNNVLLLVWVCVAWMIIYNIYLVSRGFTTNAFHSGKIEDLNQPLLRQWSNISKSASSIKTSTDTNKTLPNSCPSISPNLVGNITARMEALPFEELEMRYTELKPGGRFNPAGCTSRHRVAIIVPYRDRESHLKVLLNNLHPMLQRQQLDYGIYVVEQALPTIFNRAMLMNIGYKEALKDYDFQCFIFHDVDLIPENDKNLYTCPENPRHMSVSIDKFHYKLYYENAFGGVTALTKEHMNKVNGFSNRYFGWGKEDDDMLKRVKKSGLVMSRPAATVARYRMINHSRDAKNPLNKSGLKLVNQAEKFMTTDGLNSLSYNVLQREYKKLYTWVYVQVDDKHKI